MTNGEGDFKLFAMRPDGSQARPIVDIALSAKAAGQIDWGPRP